MSKKFEVLTKEKILALVKSFKDYYIFNTNEEIAEALSHFIKCKECPFKKECDNKGLDFCEDLFLDLVKGVN